MKSLLTLVFGAALIGIGLHLCGLSASQAIGVWLPMWGFNIYMKGRDE